MVLFINAAFREGSRTKQIADTYLTEYTEVALGTIPIAPLTAETTKIYLDSVAENCFEHPMFDFAKQFATADEIVIAAPFWNFSVPAVLHDYLELVCTQGITFGLSPDGSYYSMCKAKKLTYITTAGGRIPENDHAFGYVKTLAEVFWHISEIEYVKAERLDVYGVDAEAEIRKACKNPLE